MRELNWIVMEREREKKKPLCPGAAKSRCNQVPCWAQKLLVTEIAGIVREGAIVYLVGSQVVFSSSVESLGRCDDADADPPYIANNGLWPRFVEISNTECSSVTLDSFSITRTEPNGEVC